MATDSIEREIIIDAPPARVWTALTEAEHLARWFGDAGAEVDLRPGGRLVCSWKKHGTSHAVIEVVDPPRHFTFRWALPPGEEPRRGNSTHVEFTLVPLDGGRPRLRVRESGFGELEWSEEENRRHLNANRSGWEAEMEDLRRYLEARAA